MPCLHCCSYNCSTSLFSGISLQSLCHHKVNTRAAEEIQSKQRLADTHMHTHMNTCMHYSRLIIGTSEDLPGGSLTHLYWSSYLCALHFLSIFILLFSFWLLLYSCFSALVLFAFFQALSHLNFSLKKLCWFLVIIWLWLALSFISPAHFYSFVSHYRGRTNDDQEVVWSLSRFCAFGHFCK